MSIIKDIFSPPTIKTPPAPTPPTVAQTPDELARRRRGRGRSTIATSPLGVLEGAPLTMPGLTDTLG